MNPQRPDMVILAIHPDWWPMLRRWLDEIDLPPEKGDVPSLGLRDIWVASPVNEESE